MAMDMIVIIIKLIISDTNRKVITTYADPYLFFTGTRIQAKD